MPEHIRIYWHPMRGRNTLNFNWDAIDSDSIVHVSASEYRAKGQPLFIGESEPRIVGAANVHVDNVSPHGPDEGDPNHGVTFVVNVDWDDPLPIVTDITVFGEKPIEVQYGEGAVVS